MDDIGSVEYWNERVKQNIHDLDGMIFQDENRNKFWDAAKEQLSLWRDKRVCDVCCGWGRFAPIFSNYIGIDFSPSILEIAKQKNKDKKFLQMDVKKNFPFDAFDVVFEVNSLHCLGMTPEEFNERYGKYSQRIVACLEKDRFTVFYNY